MSVMDERGYREKVSYEALEAENERLRLKISTARLEARDQALDEAANEIEIWFDNFVRQSHGQIQSPREVILALKEKGR